MRTETKEQLIRDFQALFPDTHSVTKFRQYLRLSGWSDNAIKAIVDLYIQSELRRTCNVREQ